MRLLFVLISFLIVSNAQAKRAVPPEVKPVVKNGIQFHYEIERLNIDCPKPEDKGCGDRVFVVAKKMNRKRAGEVMWRTEVYRAIFDGQMETDVQTILPKSLRVKNANVELTDEHGEKYLVARANGKLVKPKEMVVYSGP